MKTAGDILSALFDERFMKKARGYSKLFDSWTDITAKNGIAAAADHSRIKDLDRGILLLEIDHPGWKQILQTKQGKLLNDFRRRFPGLDISGISLMLGSGKRQDAPVQEAPAQAAPAQETAIEAAAALEAVTENVEPAADAEEESSIVIESPAAKGYDAIKDEEFKKTLIRIGQSIVAREKKRKR